MPVPSQRVAIVGSRNFPRRDWVEQAVQWLWEEDPSIMIVSGGAVGVDTWAEQKARELNLRVQVFKPEYSFFGKRAPWIRNRKIVAASDYVIAFWDGQSPGTRMTIGFARELRKPFMIISP